MAKLNTPNNFSMSKTVATKLRSLPKILIVDDRQYDRILYKEFLNSSNYEFHELEDGDLVLDFLKEVVPDVIILDWQMPRMDGLDVLKLLRNNRRYNHIPIVVITGQEKLNVLEQAFDYGCHDFLIKPVNKKELVVRIHQILRFQEKYDLLTQENVALQELNDLVNSQNFKLKETSQDTLQENSIELVKLKKLLESVETQLKDITNRADSGASKTEIAKMTSALINNIRKSRSSTVDHLGVKLDSTFNKKLLKLNSGLTNLDIQHCNFLKNNLSNSDIAEIMFVEIRTLQTKRYRLKKKLGLDKDVSLRKYLIDL